MLYKTYTNIRRKEAPLGRTRVIVICVELVAIWVVYYLLGYLTALEMPLWLTSVALIAVDRLRDAISAQAQRRRDVMRE